MTRLSRADDGITMIELLVGMVIVSLLSVLSVTGWSNYQRSAELRGSAERLVSTLRNAQQSSLAEAVTYCVAFDPATRSYRSWKFACGSGTPVGPAQKTASPRVALTSPVFVQASGSTTANLQFLPRGSATKGSVVLTRQGGTRSYKITVEGLTGRVSLAN